MYNARPCAKELHTIAHREAQARVWFKSAIGSDHLNACRIILEREKNPRDVDQKNVKRKQKTG
jgi:hypothetical protein